MAKGKGDRSALEGSKRERKDGRKKQGTAALTAEKREEDPIEKIGRDSRAEKTEGKGKKQRLTAGEPHWVGVSWGKDKKKKKGSKREGEERENLGAGAPKRRPRFRCVLVVCLGLALALCGPLFLMRVVGWGESVAAVRRAVWESAGMRQKRLEQTNEVLVQAPPPPAWAVSALSRSLLAATVVQAVDLEEQLLLVLTIPCSVQHLLNVMHAPQSDEVSPTDQLEDPNLSNNSEQQKSSTNASKRAWTTQTSLSRALPLHCAYAPGTGEEELAAVLGVSARDHLVHVRCARPQKGQGMGTALTVLVVGAIEGGRGEEGVEGKEKESVDVQWAAFLASASPGRYAVGAGGVPQCRPGIVESVLKKENRAGRAFTFVEIVQTRSSSATIQIGAPAYARSHAVLARDSEDAAFLGKRLVLEVYPQSEAIYIFAQGVKWKHAPGHFFPPHTMTCIYGLNTWRAPALFGSPGEHKAIGCPYPPPEVAERLHAKSLSAEPQERLSELNLGSPMPGFVSITLADSVGVMASVAFFCPSLARPPSWRSFKPKAHCLRPGKERQALEEERAKRARALLRWSVGGAREKEHFLCSCTMGWNVAKVLKEWVLFHSWMGVEHFFIYDNNSEDELYSLAQELSQTVPHPSSYLFPFSDNSSSASAGAASSQEKQTGSGHSRGRGQGSADRTQVTVIPWPWLKSQQATFSHCVLTAGPKCRWVLFTDVDEFVFPKLVALIKTRSDLVQARVEKGPFLPLLLDWAQGADCPTPIGQWNLQSLIVGPSGQLQHPREGVALGYTCRATGHGDEKAIIRPEATRLELVHWTHLFGMGWGYQSSRRETSLAILYHYKFQAWEEYRTKFVRRAAGGVPDWKKVYSPGRTKRGDGVEIRDGEPVPPDHWERRFCQVKDESVAAFVRLVFARREGVREILPWYKGG